MVTRVRWKIDPHSSQATENPQKAKVIAPKKLANFIKL